MNGLILRSLETPFQSMEIWDFWMGWDGVSVFSMGPRLRQDLDSSMFFCNIPDDCFNGLDYLSELLLLGLASNDLPTINPKKIKLGLPQVAQLLSSGAVSSWGTLLKTFYWEIEIEKDWDREEKRKKTSTQNNSSPLPLGKHSISGLQPLPIQLLVIALYIV